MNHPDLAIQFLLNSTDPSVRYFTLTDLLDASPRSREVVAARKEIPNGARVRALLTAPGKGKHTPVGCLQPTRVDSACIRTKNGMAHTGD